MLETIVPDEEAKLLQRMADAEVLPGDGDDRPTEYYEALEALAVFYVQTERLDAARPYWERMWLSYPASCWTHENFERFAYCWFYYNGEDPEDAAL